MKTKKPNAELICKEFEDNLAPRLRLSLTDRAVYYHLLRLSHFEGKSRIHFANAGLARDLGISKDTMRTSLHRLIRHRAVRLVKRSRSGHVADVRLPGEIPGARRNAVQPRAAVPAGDGGNFEEIDFMRTRVLRRSIHTREGGVCFYCLRRIGSDMQCLDHVIPRAQLGLNSYRNLVSCCRECNSRKGDRPATDFLRVLYREGRLTSAELIRGLKSLRLLAAGKLRPVLATLPKYLPRKGRPSLS